MAPLQKPKWPAPAYQQEERPNKTPVFISDVSDTRSFVAWLRASCPGGLTDQLKGENLMAVPSTADGFRAAVSALRSLDGKDGVSFHTFTLPGDRCARLVLKNMVRGMPESVVREELEFLNFRVQGVTQLRSGSRDSDLAKDHPPPTSSCQWREGPRCQKCDRSPKSAACECRWSRMWLQNARCNASAPQRFGHTQRNCGYAPRCVACGAPTSLVDALPRRNSLSAVTAGETAQRTTVVV
jgi:hypothetical protein